MRKYRLIAKKGEGTFSEVLKAQNVKDSKYHAIKCMKNHFESIDQVNNLREIQALRRLSPHQHIVKLEEVLYDQPSGRLALVFELMDANLYEMIRGRKHYLKPDLIQSLMYQLVKSLDHMHHKGIFHRDIKPENILVDDNSKLKLADFGSCRGIYSKQPYTEYISTRWYRAPECLLTDGYYGPEMDMWGAGCVFFEITSLYPLFPGSNELDQIHRIHKILGTPSSEILELFKRKGAAHVDFNFPKEDGTVLQKLVPHASAAAVDLMNKMLSYDPAKRLNAREALRHEYFKELREMEDAQQRIAMQQQQVQGGAGGATTVPGSGVGTSQQPPFGHQSITKAMKKGKDEYPESMPPLPSIGGGGGGGLHLYHDIGDEGHEEDENEGLPPIHGGAGGLGGAGGGGGISKAGAANKHKVAANAKFQQAPGGGYKSTSSTKGYTGGGYAGVPVAKAVANGGGGGNGTNRSSSVMESSNTFNSSSSTKKSTIPANIATTNYSNSSHPKVPQAKSKKSSASNSLGVMNGAGGGGYTDLSGGKVRRK